MGKVLIVDDELSLREFLKILLGKQNHEVMLAENGEAGLVMLDQHDFDVVLTDLKMPGAVDGMDVLRYVREHHPAVQIVMMTAFATTETAIEAMKLGAYDYLQKPFKIEEVQALVNKCMEKRALLRENVQLKSELQDRYSFGKLLGKSTQMLTLFELLRKVCQSEINVLIHGESGTGKELVARAIHYNGPRAERPFVPINCGAIPEQLLESELFGHKKGTFTGADRDKLGLFQMAEGGTLFLDEIGEMPQHIQVKLLRVLQEKKVRSIGGAEDQDVDVRILSATNKNLKEEVAAGRFREDLFFRLDVLSVKLPALRERKGDIPLLCHHFIQRYSEKMGGTVRGISKAALDCLLRYEFPGNVRELENIIERGVLLEAGDMIQPDSLPDDVLNSESVPSLSVVPVVAEAPSLPEEGLEEYMENVERRLLGMALEQANGVRKDAAKLLKISFRSFRYRLAKLSMGD